ncbi:hypothetical protein Nepgr_031722 [Nepenthes gracilis]|uniref:Uncharacterized protein n=1 Tax=Nepenthes gracilis TaxID=150966 RepID=A0AAD3Y7C1_NEPGR|nr:hypothetical protein Nepgr_031722 [Nepenthes gracilis]
MPSKVKLKTGGSSESGVWSFVEVDIDYQWKPVQYGNCQQIGHNASQCKPKKIYCPTGRLLPDTHSKNPQTVLQEVVSRVNNQSSPTEGPEVPTANKFAALKICDELWPSIGSFADAWGFIGL